MANLAGIIPPTFKPASSAPSILPSGGSYSSRQSIKNGRSDYNLITRDEVYKDYLNDPTYTKGGYLSGYGDPSDPANFAKYEYSPKIYPYMLPDKIIPSQYGQTQAQSVGAQQFFVNGRSSIQGQGTAETSKPFTSNAAPASSTQAYGVDGKALQPGQAAPNSQGFVFGEKGTSNYQFMPGTFGSTQGATPFYVQQPTYASDQTLGTLTPWNPKISALQSR